MLNRLGFPGKLLGAGALALLVTAVPASAQREAFMSLSGQVQGTLDGGSTKSGHVHAFEIRSLTVNSTTAAVTIDATVDFEDFPQLVYPEVKNEPISATVTIYGRDNVNEWVVDYVVHAPRMFITETSFSTMPGEAYVVHVTLVTSGPSSIVDGGGHAVISGIPPIAAAATPVAWDSRGPIIRAKPLATTVSGDVSTLEGTQGLTTPTPGIPIVGVTWGIKMTEVGVGQPTVEPLVILKSPGGASAALTTAAAKKYGLKGDITWYAVQRTGKLAPMMQLDFTQARFSALEKMTDKGLESYSIVFPVVPTGPRVTITQLLRHYVASF